MIGLRIAALRKKMSFSQDQLAKRINVCASAIGMYEQGRREPSIKVLVALAKVFGVSLDYLVTGTEVSDHDAQKIAGVLFVLRTDISNGTQLLLLSETELIKVMVALQHLGPTKTPLSGQQN